MHKNGAPVMHSVSRASDQQKAKTMLQPMINRLEAYAIPEEKAEAVVDFAVNLFARNHKHMKLDRMVRKVVEHFKLQLKTDA